VSNLAAPKHQEELNMFDKLVESTSTGAELKPRRRIFAASFVLVAVLFAAAVVTSIYAADFDMGNDSFDIAQLLSPIAETEPPVEPEPQQERQNTRPSTSDRETRVVNQLRIEELPTTVPPISTQRNQYLSRPIGEYNLNPNGRDTLGPPSGTPDGVPGGNVPSRSSSNPSFQPESEPVANTPPPAPPRPTAPVSGGVMTGKAKSLPTPTYSAAARAVNAQGRVTVQITVDESGKVISAKAVDGHPLLRPAAVEAAWKARFDPTKLSGVPVKVTGIISYNFTK
jgi:protein TonB